jgi:hypothetical protein
MFTQLALGSILIAATSLVAAFSWLGLELILIRTHKWAARPPHFQKLAFAILLALLWSILMVTISVWIWAIAFWLLQIFKNIEASVYFSLVAFTTLGFGDILLPVEWRLLGGLAAANGLLIFGLLTAMLVETLRQTRLRQLGPKS